MLKRPDKSEYAEYYETYVSLVEETDVVAALQDQLVEIGNLLAEISEEKSSFAYAEGKWTINELIGHLIDSERVFGYRAMRVARADKTPMNGFEQDDYVKNAYFKNYKLSDLAEEFSLLRRANIIFFRNLNAEEWQRSGTANDSEVSVRALAFMMVGHIRHHTKILRERYLAR